MQASVPLLTILIMSTFGTMLMMSSAISISSSVGAPKDVELNAFPGWLLLQVHKHGRVSLVPMMQCSRCIYCHRHHTYKRLLRCQEYWRSSNTFKCTYREFTPPGIDFFALSNNSSPLCIHGDYFVVIVLIFFVVVFTQSRKEAK